MSLAKPNMVTRPPHTQKTSQSLGSDWQHYWIWFSSVTAGQLSLLYLAETAATILKIIIGETFCVVTKQTLCR